MANTKNQNSSSEMKGSKAKNASAGKETNSKMEKNSSKKGGQSVGSKSGTVNSKMDE